MKRIFIIGSVLVVISCNGTESPNKGTVDSVVHSIDSSIKATADTIKASVDSSVRKADSAVRSIIDTMKVKSAGKVKR